MGLSGGQIAGIVIGSTFGAFIAFCLVGRILQVCGYTLRKRSNGRAIIHHALDAAKITRHRVAAHRGGSVNGHENCLPTFLAAVKAGAGLLELDVCVSADGVPIVAHDELLARVIDPDWLKAHPDITRVDQLLAANPNDLPPLASRIQLHFRTQKASHFDAAVGSFTVVGSPFAHSAPAMPIVDAAVEIGAVQQQVVVHLPRFCTLQELFDACPRDVILHVDVKQRSDALVRAVVALVHAYDRGATTVLGAGNPQNADVLAEMFERRDRGQLPPGNVMLPVPDISTFSALIVPADAGAKTAPLLPNGAVRPASYGSVSLQGAPFLRFAGAKSVLGTLLGYKLGLLPFSSLSFDVFSVPYPTTLMQHRFKAFGLPSIVLWVFEWLMSPAVLQYLQRRGIAIYTWVLNDEAEFTEAAKVYMDGIMTDDVVGLAAFCAANGQLSEPLVVV